MTKRIRRQMVFLPWLSIDGLAQHSWDISELEKLYAEAPDYEDVTTRLGV